jgi:hypothetical protein
MSQVRLICGWLAADVGMDQAAVSRWSEAPETIP